MNVVRWKVFGLSPYIRKESIRMAGDGSFTIISVQHQNVTIFPILIPTGFKVLRCLRMLQQRLYMAHVGPMAWCLLPPKGCGRSVAGSFKVGAIDRKAGRGF